MRWTAATDEKSSALLRRLPRVLYRYSSLAGDHMERVKRVLLQSELYFASYTKFNDPLDCRITLDFKASTLKREQYWRQSASRFFPGTPRSQRKAQVSRMVNLSQTPVGREDLNRFAFQEMERHGIVCLSKPPDNVLMWSYYGDGHKGIAIRFNMDPRRLIGLTGTWCPAEVHYSEKPPCINFFDADAFDLAQGIFGTKAKAWEHESEWRIVLLNRTGVVRIPPSMIDGVILGLRSDEDSARRIRQWAKERPVPTEVLRVVNEKDSFALRVVPV